MRTSLVALLALIVLVPPQGALASGFKVNEQGSKAGGMGLAFVGQADDVTTLSMNIAGIGQLEGTNAAFTLAALYVPPREFDSDIAAVADQEPDSQLFPIPSLFVSQEIGHTGFNAGLGVYSMFGLSQDWNLVGSIDRGIVVPPAGFSRLVDRVEFRTVFINPSLVYEIIRDHVSVGAGFIVGYGDLQVDNSPVVNLTGLGAGVRELGEMTQDVHGYGYSFNVAIHYTGMDDRLRVGAYYRHKMGLDMDGEFEADNLEPLVFGAARAYSTDAQIELNLPGTVGLGFAYDVNCRLTVEVDGEYNTWSAFDRVDVGLAAPLVSAGGVPIITNTTLSRNPEWDDSWAVRAGAQYKVTPHIAARGGYFYDTTPVPDDTLDPLVPDADRHGFTAGAGDKTCHWTIDVAYMLVLVMDRSVANDALAPQIPVQDGNYSSDPTHVFMMTIGYSF